LHDEAGTKKKRRESDEHPDQGTTRAKEVSEMLEGCYCGRTGEIEDREPVATGDGGRALRCHDCGHLESLDWLPEEPGTTSSRRRRAGNWRWRKGYTAPFVTERPLAVPARSDRTSGGKRR
jgi:hypothetical protein